MLRHLGDPDSRRSQVFGSRPGKFMARWHRSPTIRTQQAIVSEAGPDFVPINHLANYVIDGTKRELVVRSEADLQTWPARSETWMISQ